MLLSQWPGPVALDRNDCLSSNSTEGQEWTPTFIAQGPTFTFNENNNNKSVVCGHRPVTLFCFNI